jgi:hypothetical protein
MRALHSVLLVDVDGARIASLPNMPFGDWSEGHLVAHDNVVYVVRGVGNERQLGSENVVLTVARARR